MRYLGSIVSKCSKCVQVIHCFQVFKCVKMFHCFQVFQMCPSVQMCQKLTDIPRFRDAIASTGCPTKNYTLFWKAVAPLNSELGIKIGGVLESSGSKFFKTVPTFDFWPSYSWDIWGWRHQGSLLDIIFLYYSYIKCSF